MVPNFRWKTAFSENRELQNPRKERLNPSSFFVVAT